MFIVRSAFNYVNKWEAFAAAAFQFQHCYLPGVVSIGHDGDNENCFELR